MNKNKNEEKLLSNIKKNIDNMSDEQKQKLKDYQKKCRSNMTDE